MKKYSTLIFFAAIAFIAVSCQNKDSIVINTNEQPQLNNIVDSLSWAMGFSIAQNIASTGVDFNRELLLQAICATLDSKQQPMTQQQTLWHLQELEKEAYINQSRSAQSASNEAKAREEAYFEKLTHDNPNVKYSDKGFYYEVLKEGSGRQGSIGLVVVFDYKGFFTNGQLFDQTYGNREPITHVIGEPLMPGLLEGFCMMKAGSTYRFYFPYEMAYGPKGAPEDGIPAYSTLIYEVEVHEIKD